MPVVTAPEVPCKVLRTEHSSTLKLLRSVEWQHWPGGVSSRRLQSLASRRAREPTLPIASLTRALRRSCSLIRCVRLTSTKESMVVQLTRFARTQMSAPLMIQQTGSDSEATAPDTKIATNKYARATKKGKEVHSKEFPQATTSPSSIPLIFTYQQLRAS